MLLVAAALLTASMHSLGVIEAPGVPAPEAVVWSGAGAGPDDVLGPVRAWAGAQRPLGRTATARGRAFLDDLAALSAPELARADQDRRVLATAQDHPPTADEVATWWAALTSVERGSLVTGAPSVVGNLEGVPYAVRDTANRTVLAHGLAEAVEGHDSGRTPMLRQVRDALVHADDAAERFLITLDTRGSGRAAIAIGDLDTATDVTVVVPGMFFTVAGQMVDFTNTANDLQTEQVAVAGAQRTATCAPDPAAPGADARSRGIAVVAWMGYRTPDLSNILSLDLARVGADRLERAVDGLREIRSLAEPRVNIVAHSYGSTTAMTALSSGRMRADSLTVFGSPGSGVRSAAQLAVPSGAVFVGDAHSDPIAGTGYFGTDPGSSTFGSTVLDLASVVDARTSDGAFRQPVGHNDYLKPGTASLHDVALIAVGQDAVVRDEARRGRDGGNGVPPGSPDMYLVRPQDLQQRD